MVQSYHVIVFLFLVSMLSGHSQEVSESEDSLFQFEETGFRFSILNSKKVALPADLRSGLSFLGSPAKSFEELKGNVEGNRYRVTNADGKTAMVEVATTKHTIKITVGIENGLSGRISLRTGGGGPSYGLGDQGGWESNANLSATKKKYPLKHNGHAHRFISSFLIFPQRGVGGVFFQKRNGEVTIGPDSYEMTNGSTSKQTFYYFVGSMEEIYAAYRKTRIEHGFPGVRPKMAGFELGWESWDLLKWKTSAATCQKAIEGFLERGYHIRWAVTGSGFWSSGGSTTSFGNFDREKYPDTRAPTPPDFGDWAADNGIHWLIGQRTNFVKTGGPHSSKPGESGATMFKTSPKSEDGLKGGYFLKTSHGKPTELRSSVFPTVPCYVLDGNIPGAGFWFKELYDQWGVDGVKEDTMLAVSDHTVFNLPMRLIAGSGDLVMARCAAYSSPGTLTRVNDTGGANSMGLRCPINYLQYGASAVPNVYSDTVGFGGMRNVESTMRHAWLLSLTAGMAVSDSPWNHRWSKGDEANFKKAIDFHYEIGPYLYSAAIDSYNSGYPHTLTPLPIAFPEDSATADLASKSMRQFEWMIGPSLLATPLLHRKYPSPTQLDIYLPAGKWIDIETGTVYSGPTTLKKFELPLGKTPIFVGGKGVYVSRSSDKAPLNAVVFPVAKEGSIYRFTFPDGTSTCSIKNNNEGWELSRLRVREMEEEKEISFTIDQTTGSIRFPIEPGGRYELLGGQ